MTIEHTLPCEFCEEFARPNTSSNRIVLERDGFVVVPTLGAYMKWYLLVLPREHVPSFAALPDDRRRAGLLLAWQIILRLGDQFPSWNLGSFILAEHGTAGLDTAACVEHAHLHLIPVGVYAKPRRILEWYRETGGGVGIRGDARAFNNFRGRSYVMLSTGGDYELWLANEFSCQFVRRVCAEVSGMGDEFDWRSHPFHEQMEKTLEECRQLLADLPKL